MLTKGLYSKVQRGEFDLLLFIFLVLIVWMGLAYLVKQRFLPLMDEVNALESGLGLRRGTKRVKIKFTDIDEVKLSRSNPPIITLLLNRNCEFGGKVSFVPHMRTFSFQKIPTFDDLQSLVAEAKEKS